MSRNDEFLREEDDGIALQTRNMSDGTLSEEDDLEESDEGRAMLHRVEISAREKVREREEEDDGVGAEKLDAVADGAEFHPMVFIIVAMLGMLGLISMIVFVSLSLNRLGQRKIPGAGNVPDYVEPCQPRKIRVPSVEEMTLPEKVGQMMQINHKVLGQGDDVTKYFIGSILSGGGGSPSWGNSAADWAVLVDNLQAKSQKTRLQIPLVYGADAVHGHNNVADATIFPHHVGLGASRNASLVRHITAAAALEVMGTGVRWSFSPAVTVCQDPRWGRCYESFAELPVPASDLAEAEIDGWQEAPISVDRNFAGSIFIAATAKHFVGDGGTTGGKDEGDTSISEGDLRKVHLPPYFAALKHNVQTIMVSYSSWRGLAMHENEYLLTGVLRKEMGFEGVLVSDWAAIQKLNGTFGDQIQKSINAGIDMVMVPNEYKEFAAALMKEVEEGRISIERIDQSVRRILQLKENLGLFEHSCAHKSFLHHVGSDAHRSLARDAVRQSLVLLKNERRDLSGPFFPMKFEGPGVTKPKIVVAGRHANDIGLQCGGWTIFWQGGTGNITKGTTILEGIQSAVELLGGKVEYVEEPSGEVEGDYGVVVVGEKPYAEWYGDDQTLQLNSTARNAISAVCGKMPCVVVLISGRVLAVTPFLEDVDALVAAWLPGSEGGKGIADVLFGDYDFTGQTPFSWFKFVDDLPVTKARPSHYDPLFEFGFGLNKQGEQVGLKG